MSSWPPDVKSALEALTGWTQGEAITATYVNQVLERFGSARRVVPNELAGPAFRDIVQLWRATQAGTKAVEGSQTEPVP